MIGAVLLGGAGYLLSHAGGAASNLGGGDPVGGSSVGTAPESGRDAPVPLPIRSRSLSGGGNPLLGSRTAPEPPGAAPFSQSWREQATPNVTLPSSPPSPVRGSGGNASTPAQDIPRSSSASPGIETRRDRADGAWMGEEADWRSDARRLAGRARALSGQLRQMTKDGSSGEEKAKNSSSPTEGDASTAAARSDDRDVPSPPQVPLGGAEWLAAAGAAYALNRLRDDGSEETDDEE